MKIKAFRYGVKGLPEINFIGEVWNLRIALGQLALWKHYRPVFDLH